MTYILQEYVILRHGNFLKEVVNQLLTYHIGEIRYINLSNMFDDILNVLIVWITKTWNSDLLNIQYISSLDPRKWPPEIDFVNKIVKILGVQADDECFDCTTYQYFHDMHHPMHFPLSRLFNSICPQLLKSWIQRYTRLSSNDILLLVIEYL